MWNKNSYPNQRDFAALFLTLIAFYSFPSDVFALNPLEKVYESQKKAIKSVQDRVKRTSNEIYDEQRRIIKKAQDSLTPEQKKEVKEVIANIEKNLIKKTTKQINQLNKEIDTQVSQIKRQGEKIQKLADELKKKADRTRTNLWAAIGGLITTILTIVGLIMEIVHLKRQLAAK